MLNEKAEDIRHREQLMIKDYELAILMIKEIWPDQEKNYDLHCACDLVVYNIIKEICKLNNGSLH